MLFRIAVPLLSVVVFVAIVEVVVRISGVDTTFRNRLFVLNRALDYPDVFQKDHDLFWRFRPNRTVRSKFFEGKTYRINSLGLRGEEIPPVKSKKRILALGNSCTFGWGVAWEETYIKQLEHLLGGDWRVINGGIPGYTSYQGKLFFERELVKLEPDIVLIMFAWNDHWAAAHQVADKDQQFPSPFIIDVQNVLSRLHSYRLAKKVYLSLMEGPPDSLFRHGAPVYRVGLDDYTQNLKEICAVARSHGIRPILLTSPIPSLRLYYPSYMKSPLHKYHQKYNEAVRRLAREEGIDLVDLAEEFDKYPDLWDDAQYDPIHFNAKGHRLAAECIAQYLKEKVLSRSPAN